MSGATADPAALSATQAAARIRAGSLTAEVLMRACLDRIKGQDGHIRAFVHLDADNAMEKALASDLLRARHGPSGPLDGVPVAVKDVIDTAELPTEHGSPLFAGNPPPADAACVRQLRAAGAIVIGKTVTAELASLTPGPTRNPHDPARTPGGSSSGSAAAVASGMAPFALGTQTAGSVLRPASFCGIHGFKPSFGLVSRAGVLMQSQTLDTVGVLTRSVADAALAVDCMSACDPADHACWPYGRGGLLAQCLADAPATPKLAFCRTPVWGEAEEAMQVALEEFVRRLGDSCERLDLPQEFASIADKQSLIQWAENAFHYGPLHDRGKDRMSAGMRARMETGFATGARDYQAAVAAREELYAVYAELTARFDAVICPAAPGPAPQGLETTGSPIFNGLWTYLGVPAISLPLLTGQGMPMGVQLVGHRRKDGSLLRMARWLEARAGHDPVVRPVAPS